jgi:hypothetical protein
VSPLRLRASSTPRWANSSTIEDFSKVLDRNRAISSAAARGLALASTETQRARDARLQQVLERDPRCACPCRSRIQLFPDPQYRLAISTGITPEERLPHSRRSSIAAVLPSFSPRRDRRWTSRQSASNVPTWPLRNLPPVRFHADAKPRGRRHDAESRLGLPDRFEYRSHVLISRTT